MTFFNYFQSIPNPPNLPSQDVPNMQTNTNSIYSILNVDHETFGSQNSIDGRHKQVSLINQSAPGVPANIGGVIFANNPVSQSWPFWQNAAGTTQIISGIPNAASTGVTYLPGGIVMQWGTIMNAASQTSTPVTFVGIGGISFPTNCFVVMTTPNEGSSTNANNMNVTSVSNTGFTYYNTSSSMRNYFWLAVGN